MLRLKKVAITGGLSCGKSSVCRFFKQLGACVVSADEVVHQLLSPTTQLGHDIIKLLGPDVLNDQQFDRKKIANKVFQDQELLAKYEKLIHPAVRMEVERRYQKAKTEVSCALFIAEIPLLYEVGGEKDYDATIVVTADPKVCRKRFAKQKNSPDPEEYDRRMARQLTIQSKARQADYLIQNNGTLDELKKSVEETYQKLLH